MNYKKALLGAVVLAAVGAFFVFDLGRFLDLQAMQSARSEFAAHYASRPYATLALFALIYVAVTALSLPGAAVLTLVAGALFGLVAGTIVVSFASSIGATLAMLVSRYLLRDAVRGRFAQRLSEIDRGVEREGSFYLFTLRLVPLFPFFVINLVMGLTRMRAGTFYWVSQVGMLAGTIVYVNAGTQLGQLRSLEGIFSPALLASFVLLGVFPLLARRLLRLARARRIYSRWRGNKPRRFDRNLVVIGAGAAGLVTSYIAAAVKASVTLVEAQRMGGDCLNSGCVPSKALIHAASIAHQARKAGAAGIGIAPPAIDFGAVMRRVADVVRRVEPHDSVERYTALGVDVVLGKARIVDPWRVQIERQDGATQELSTRAMVIATGAEPIVPPVPGIEDSGYLTSETLWGLTEAPQRLLVLGGGPIGCELAQAFARLGSSVVLVEMAAQLLGREDGDVAEHLLQCMRDDGVDVRVGAEVVQFDRDTGGRYAIVDSGGNREKLHYDTLLCAVGRRARLTGYGLEALGIRADKTIVHNEFLQTDYPNILVAGDVAGPYQLTHVGAHQAWYAAVNALFGGWKRFRADYRVLPAVTFTDPQVARVGLNEQEAKSRNQPFEAIRYQFAELDRAIADDKARGWVKVLTLPGSDRILGVTIVAPDAGELIAEWVLAMKHGLGLSKLLATVHAYPTLVEANKYAAGEWRRAHQPQRLLAGLARYHRWRLGSGAPDKGHAKPL
ncbi:MAG: FAD-dependent oxidoreductase [Steroidobacteraceae bacterium]